MTFSELLQARSACRRDAPYSAWTRGKSALDQLTNVPHWTLHGLRRTGATLMERAGVLPHVIEATLGHTIPGVAGAAIGIVAVNCFQLGC
jgi:integrase